MEHDFLVRSTGILWNKRNFWKDRAFSIYKNFGNFLLEISVREERVPSVISSIRGSRGTPGRELYGTGDKSDKYEKSVNET